jgi:DNA-binding LacI/PurR family transcriptional regulator
MNAASLEIDPELVHEGDFSEKSGQLGAHYLLDLPQPPTAIVCNNDRMAMGAMHAIQARGLTVGEHVSVVGYDNVPLSRFSNPPLTTLSQPTRLIGAMLFNLLLSIIDGQPDATLSGKLVTPELHVRQSTGRSAKK